MEWRTTVLNRVVWETGTCLGGWWCNWFGFGLVSTGQAEADGDRCDVYVEVSSFEGGTQMSKVHVQRTGACKDDMI